MAKKSSVSKSKIMQLCGKHNDVTLKFNNEDGDSLFEIKVHPFLTLTECCQFQRFVIDAVVGAGSAELTDVVFNSAVLTYYTNLDYSKLGLTLDDVYALDKDSSFFGAIKAEILNDLDSMRRGIDAEIDNKLHPDVEGRLGSFLDELSSKFDGLNVERLVELSQRIAEKDEYEIAEAVLNG